MNENEIDKKIKTKREQEKGREGKGKKWCH